MFVFWDQIQAKVNFFRFFKLFDHKSQSIWVFCAYQSQQNCSPWKIKQLLWTNKSQKLMFQRQTSSKFRFLSEFSIFLTTTRCVFDIFQYILQQNNSQRLDKQHFGRSLPKEIMSCPRIWLKSPSWHLFLQIYGFLQIFGHNTKCIRFFWLLSWAKL